MGIQKVFIGDRFGRLVVIEKSHIDRNLRIVWNCKCDCGNTTQVNSASLRIGDTKSCGCLKSDVLTKHSKSATKEYRVWADMIQRCTNPLSTNYKYYGAKGVLVCERWLNSFKNFLEDMGNRPSPQHSLDRIIVESNYEPGNCKWSTRHEQNRNTRRNIYYEMYGQRLVLQDWATFFGVSRSSLRWHINRLTPEQLLAKYKPTK